MNIGVTDSTKPDSKAHIILATEVPLDRDDLKKQKLNLVVSFLQRKYMG